MSLPSQDAPRWPAPLTGRLPAEASVEQVAEAVAAVWLEIDQALHPVIGHRGVAALYNRSLSVTAKAHPWVAVGHKDVLALVDPAALRAALAQQAAPDAAAGAHALFQSFHTLLASLVGAALTNRLLDSVWAYSAATPPAQDTSS